jgi:hypothetical protein
MKTPNFPSVMGPLFLALSSLSLSGCLSPRIANPLDPTKYRSQILAGPVVGVTRNFHTGGFRTIDEPLCPMFEEGSGWGYLLGVTAEYIPRMDGYWSLIPRVTYERRPGNFTEHLPEVPVLPAGEHVPINQSVDVVSTVSYDLLSAELMYKREFAQIGYVRFAAEAGPAGALVLGGRNRQTEDLIDPPNARFINPLGLPTELGGRRLILYDGDIPGRIGTRLSLKGGVQAEIPLFDFAWIMTPGIYYDYGITDVTHSENWRLNSLIFTVDFRRAF